tara:strand:- start:580 stop:1095 length:516 start_codon:yes stop_codon:yes gene_type:complete
VTGLTAYTAGAGGGLNDMSEFARTTALLGLRGNISGDVILGFVFGSLRTSALLGWSGNISGDVGLRFVSGPLRAAALLGFEGNISGDVILGFVFGSLRAAALLGWFRRGGVLIDFLGGGGEDQVGDLLGEVISAAVGSGDIVRDVINKVFDFFHECDGKKRCVRRHDIRIK